MIPPVHFGWNPETSEDNFFQQRPSSPGIQSAAGMEYRRLVALLTSAGIEVLQLVPEDNLATADEVFADNWFSVQPDQTLFIYPLKNVSRRLERRPAFIQALKRRYPKVMDMSPYENRGLFLEGTGSLVADHRNKQVFVSLSGRTSGNLAHEWSRITGYEVIPFASEDVNGNTVYHTNVMMYAGENFAVVCRDAITTLASKERVMDALRLGNRDIIEISMKQMHAFCANCIELRPVGGENLLIMSETAFASFTPDQRERLSAHGNILHTDISTLEACGGGSVRCMITELY